VERREEARQEEGRDESLLLAAGGDGGPLAPEPPQEGGRRRARRAGRRRARERREGPQLYRNYSKIPLTTAMKEVLNKGPSFVPDRQHVNHVDVKVGVFNLKRNMRWDERFQRLEKEREEEDEEQDEEDEPEERILKDRVKKANLPKGAPPRALLAYENANSFNLLSPGNLRKIAPNFPPHLRSATEDLVRLQREREIIIKPTDKTGCWAIMPFEGYDESMKEKLKEVYLENGVEKPKYVASSKARLAKEYKELKRMIWEGVDSGFISEKDGLAAMPEEPTAGRLYGLLKDHKPVRPETGLPPLREVVSCSGGNLEGPGKIVDHFLQEVDERVPTFIRDTPHLLRLIEELNAKGPQPPGTRLYSLDIVAMYPSIPTSRAPAVLRQRLLRAGMAPDLAGWLTRLVELMLKSSTFEYDESLYTQATGTSIGAPHAPAYAGIYVGHVEEEGARRWEGRGGARRREELQGLAWREGDRAETDWNHRYRDDCIGLYRGTQAEFPGLLGAMNSVDPDVQFTAEIDWEENKLVFLDLIITIDEQGFLRTDLHTKPNTKNRLLLPSSAHPPSATRSSVYSLALRIRRICSSEEAAEVRFGELAARLKERHYSEAVIQAGIARARAVPRAEALKKVERPQEPGRQHRLVITYDRRSSPALGPILEENYQQMVAQDQRLGRTFPKVPRPVYRRGKSLQDILCRAKLPPRRPVRTRAAEEGRRHGLTRCNRGGNRVGCIGCSYITSRPAEVVKSVTITSTNVVIPVEGSINCKTTGGFLYLLWSSKAPAVQYLGSSGQTPGARLTQHRRDIMDGAQKAVAQHFRDTRSTVDHLVFRPFKRITSKNNLAVRMHFEHEAINKYNMIEAGVNRILT
jgi:hypothetical protein